MVESELSETSQFVQLTTCTRCPTATYFTRENARETHWIRGTKWIRGIYWTRGTRCTRGTQGIPGTHWTRGTRGTSGHDKLVGHTGFVRRTGLVGHAVGTHPEVLGYLETSCSVAVHT